MKTALLELLAVLLALTCLVRCQSNYESDQVNEDGEMGRTTDANCVFVGCSCGEDEGAYFSNEAEYNGGGGGGGGGAAVDQNGSPYGQGYDVVCHIDQSVSRDFPERDTSKKYSNLISSIEVILFGFSCYHTLLFYL